MNSDERPEEDDDGALPMPVEIPVIDAVKLLGDHREICLELDGTRYRLRLTRRNKLILQK
jgi:hemin uptake protein HemP